MVIISKRAGYKRAYSPRKDYATINANNDMIKRFDESFKDFTKKGIIQQIELSKKVGCKPTDVFDFYLKRYNYHYRKGRR